MLPFLCVTQIISSTQGGVKYKIKYIEEGRSEML